jgi:lipopolysaccharide biosynthesis regulator YciM
MFGLLFAAIAIGWLLGRRHAGSRAAPGHYFSGRGGALEEVPGRVADMPVDEAAQEGGSSTRSRIAMGVQLRRRGEVDGAVRIHQDLLALPSLPDNDAAQARLELARDYISAGLLDRAEELLLGLVKDVPQQRRAGQRHLLEIYEIERDWRRAIEIARALLPQKLARQHPAPQSPPESGQRAALRLAHYCCELAEEQRLSGDPGAARRLLLEALARDKRCVRASMLLSQVESDCGHYRRAVQALRRVCAQDPDYLPMTIAPLRKCYEALGDQQSLHGYLLECLAVRPTPALLTAVAEDIARSEGRPAAVRFLAARLPEYPSLGGLSQLIELQVDAHAGESREDFKLLQATAQRLLASRPSYRCGHCGFAGKHLHWNCPGCKYWGTMKAIDGAGQ